MLSDQPDVDVCECAAEQREAEGLALAATAWRQHVSERFRRRRRDRRGARRALLAVAVVAGAQVDGNVQKPLFTWEKQVLSARGFKRLRRHSEYFTCMV